MTKDCQARLRRWYTRSSQNAARISKERELLSRNKSFKGKRSRKTALLCVWAETQFPFLSKRASETTASKMNFYAICKPCLRWLVFISILDFFLSERGGKIGKNTPFVLSEICRISHPFLSKTGRTTHPFLSKALIMITSVGKEA